MSVNRSITLLALLAIGLSGAAGELRAQLPTMPPPTQPLSSLPTTAPDFQSTLDLLYNRVRKPVTLRDSGVSLIDPSMVQTNIRLRYDQAYQVTRPDQGEFFWPRSPLGRGPTLLETSVDYQDLSIYAEYAWSGSRWSIAGELPVRFVNPEVNPNRAGLADGNLALKWALLQSPDSVVTLQFRTYFPSGSGTQGLGTRHVSIEPAVLGYYRLGKSLAWEGELRDTVPLGGTPGFQANVVRYGTGMTYTMADTGAFSARSVVEFVGWTLTGGDVTINDGGGLFHTQSAAGETIFNVAVGGRFNLGERTSAYTGYVHSVASAAWYRDLFRVELRYAF